MGERDTLVAARDGSRASAGPATGTRPARAGIVGAGFIGTVHARSAPLAGARLAGVATSTPEARNRVRSGSLRPVRLITGAYLQDWPDAPEDDNWRVDAGQNGPSRAIADIGSHSCDLVEFITGERITALCAQTATVFGERADSGSARAFADGAGAAAGARREVPTEDAVTAVCRTGSGAHGTFAVSQVSPGRKNHLHVGIACAEASVRFEQERPETLWLGRRGVSETVTRGPGTLAPEAARYAVVPAGHPQGYLDCFDLFAADTYAAMRGEGVSQGLPTFADGARSAHLIDAVLASAAAGGWVEVP